MIHIRKYFLNLRGFDWYLFIGVLLIVCFGFVALYSFELSSPEMHFSTLKKQAIALLIGLLVMFAISMIDYRIFLSVSRYGYMLAIALLLTVLFLGVTLRGTRGWITLGGWNFQVVELVKIMLLLFLASFFAKFGRGLRFLRYIIWSGVFTLILFLLVILQPDLGSALILFFLWFGYILVVGTKRRNVLFLVLVVLIAGVFAWAYVLKDYQKERVLTFLHPTNDPLGEGYSIQQARVAIGSGGWFGRGVGLGTQSQLKFLPAAHTDFIISLIAEELGFFGAAILLLFFAFIFFRIIQVARGIPDDISVLLLVGIVLLIFSQMFINVGVNFGLLPVTGISLPFVSYGGSSLVVNFILIGLAESVIIHRRTV